MAERDEHSSGAFADGVAVGTGGILTVRGVRGATTAEANTPEAIWAATADLLREMLRANDIAADSIAAVFFSATPDLNAAYPATAARKLGLTEVPLFGSQEVMVEGSPAKCIRVLILFNTAKTQGEIRHVYLKEASHLRPDLAEQGANPFRR